MTLQVYQIIAIFAGLYVLLMIRRQIMDAYPPKWRTSRWDEKQRHTLLQPEVNWQSWFAWRPVRTISGDRIWFKKIYRTLGNDYVDHDDWSWYHYGTIFDVLRTIK